MATANQEQSSQEEGRGAGLCLQNSKDHLCWALNHPPRAGSSWPNSTVVPEGPASSPLGTQGDRPAASAPVSPLAAFISGSLPAHRSLAPCWEGQEPGGLKGLFGHHGTEAESWL